MHESRVELPIRSAYHGIPGFSESPSVNSSAPDHACKRSRRTNGSRFCITIDIERFEYLEWGRPRL